MTTITQAPAELDLAGVAGDPFGLVLNIALTDAVGNAIPWSAFTGASVEVVVSGAIDASLAPTITIPQAGQLSLAWNATQTSTIGGWKTVQWALSATIEGVGPESLVAGTLTFSPATQPGTSGPASANLAVSVGTVTASMVVTLGSAGVQQLTAADGTIMIGGTATDVTVKVTPNVFDAFGAAAAEASRAEAAEALLAPKASPAFTGTPTAPTASPLTDNTQLATTAYADAATAVETGRAEAAEALLIPLTQKGAANGVAILDSGGKIPTSELPAITMNTVWPNVVSQAAMLALAAEPGDVAVRTDVSANFMLAALPASTLTNWIQLADATSPVTSVFGRTGAVSLLKADVIGTGLAAADVGADAAGSATTALATATGRAVAFAIVFGS